MLPDATGRLFELLPDSCPEAEREALLGLVRLGAAFRRQQRGKRPGALARLVLDRARRAGPPYSFAQLLDVLEDEVAQYGSDARSPVDQVNRVRETVTVCLPRQDGREVPFATLRRHLTAAKKILKSEIRTPPKPRKR